MQGGARPVASSTHLQLKKYLYIYFDIPAYNFLYLSAPASHSSSALRNLFGSGNKVSMTRRTKRAPRKTAASAPRATATTISIPLLVVGGPALLMEIGELIIIRGRLEEPI
ncbi:hypothetical protein PUN28_019942 [Cardiocondyla obscurior]|uniref:Uncharacterized protein n=1 Tax=Cardiocondyla obscurior TaxID=286306 RepID=A0AAW2E865_9HYME